MNLSILKYVWLVVLGILLGALFINVPNLVHLIPNEQLKRLAGATWSLTLWTIEGQFMLPPFFVPLFLAAWAVAKLPPSKLEWYHLLLFVPILPAIPILIWGGYCYAFEPNTNSLAGLLNGIKPDYQWKLDVLGFFTLNSFALAGLIVSFLKIIKVQNRSIIFMLCMYAPQCSFCFLAQGICGMPVTGVWL